ncbi:MAG: methylated-DNA--[protein]-cysteine S-methyltransferase [Verrucomicrobiae bacterium]|nr:methylated-DNA--[protein]-cysteine S-methyltransferase [Verrucomicrobiae bacterium]
MSAYERIAGVVRYLEANRAAQPDLATLAREAGLSPSRFHRLFVAWAGVTPKEFLECLTVAEVKRRLRAGEDVLRAALESGMSGPGRAHDLCVRLEAASPGEWKSGGAGWTVVAGMAESPFGRCLIAEGPRGVCHLTFPGREEEAGEWARLEATWPAANVLQDDGVASGWVERIFRREGDGRAGTAGVRAYVRGSEFQVRVWRALLEIPAGALVTYGQLAARVGCAGAARAVGSAVGRNPLGYLIPCHRVIRGTGVVGEYRWGRERKVAMLMRETGGRLGGVAG